MQPQLDARPRELFQLALVTLREANLPFVVAGAFALNYHTGVWRDTKDLDLFCETRGMRILLRPMQRTPATSPAWW